MASEKDTELQRDDGVAGPSDCQMVVANQIQIESQKWDPLPYGRLVRLTLS
jgi:hypothetical protein